MAHATFLAAVPALVAQGMPLHVAVVPAFCAFLAFQLYLYVNHRRAVAQQQKTLESLRQHGGTPEQRPATGYANDQWCDWVVARFYDGAFSDGRYTREDALGQLDNWLEGNGSYLLLQRMGYMAPLLGVVLTAGGFLFLEVPPANAIDLQRILATVTPLILGVGTGASLAIINQLLLHLAGRGTDGLRASACRWFDDCVWKYVQAKPRTAAMDAADALQAMAEAMRTYVDQYRGATAAIGDTSRSLQGAGMALVETVERLRLDTAAIPDEMKSLRGMANSVIASLGDIVPNIERTTSELAESVGAFKSVVQVPLAQAAARHQESAEVFAGSVAQIRESASQLGTQVGSFAQVIHAQAAASEEWSRSLRDEVLPAQRSFQHAGVQLVDATKDLAPAQQAFRHAADSMRGSAESLAASVHEGFEPATRKMAELDQILTRMRETTEAVRQMTQLRQEFAVLARSLSQIAAAADAIRDLPQEIQAAVRAGIPSHNGDTAPRSPFFLRILGFRGQTNGRR